MYEIYLPIVLSLEVDLRLKRLPMKLMANDNYIKYNVIIIKEWLYNVKKVVLLVREINRILYLSSEPSLLSFSV